MICWILWTDVVPDTFHPYFHRSKRAHGKQHILTESCLIQKRLSLQRKVYKGKQEQVPLQMATQTTEKEKKN